MNLNQEIEILNLNDLQREVMQFIDKWAREEKTPIPRTEIISAMNGKGIKSYSTISSIKVLLKKGFIRRSSIRTNKTYYIQLRRA